jgi:hypothetical protein
MKILVVIHVNRVTILCFFDVLPFDNHLNPDPKISGLLKPCVKWLPVDRLPVSCLFTASNASISRGLAVLNARLINRRIALDATADLTESSLSSSTTITSAQPSSAASPAAGQVVNNISQQSNPAKWVCYTTDCNHGNTSRLSHSPWIVRHWCCHAYTHSFKCVHSRNAPRLSILCLRRTCTAHWLPLETNNSKPNQPLPTGLQPPQQSKNQSNQ